MDRYTFIKNDFRKLLTGFRFHPTDEELVVHYLKPKAFSRRLPVSFIHEVDVCKSNPWDLPGDKKQEMYFFSIKEAKYPSGNRTNRATSRGYWKATGKDKKIGTLRSNQVVGMKKTLVFYHGRAPNGSRTDWIMHEYRLSEPCNDSHESKTSKAKNSSVPMENWVLCRVFLKKRGSKSEDDNKISCDDNVEKISGMKMPILHDFISHESFDLNVAPSSSSSGSSGVTVVSSNVSDDHEESSSCKIVPCLQKRP